MEIDIVIGIVTVNFVAIVSFLTTFFINKLSNRGIFFGVRFPMEYLKEQELLNMEKTYKKIISAVFFIIAVTANLVGFKVYYINKNYLGFIIGMVTIAILIVLYGIFLVFHFKAKKIKKKRGWTYKNRNIVVVDTTLRKPKKDERIKAISSVWFLTLLVFPIIIILITLFKYNKLPEIIDIKGMTYGVFNPHTTRGRFIMFQIPLVQFFIGILMYLVSLIINNSKVDLNSGKVEVSVIRKKKIKKITSIMMMIIALQMMIMYSLIQASMLFNFYIAEVSYIFLSTISTTIVIFIIILIKESYGERGLHSSKEKDELYKDDDHKWKLGAFYYNKNDPAWIVEKRIGIGWTVNFANPKSWAAIILLIVFIVISIVINSIIN